jgi:mannitol-1-phosphate/altronate dehydrogenase
MSAALAALAEFVLNILTKGVALWLAFRAGRNDQAAETTKQELETRDEQAKAAVDRPHTRDDLVRRLRDKGL